MTLIRKITFITAVLTVLALVASCGGNPTFTPTATSVSPALPTATTVSPPATPTVPTVAASTPARDLRITVVYDNIAHDSRLKTAWGLAALIESGGHTLLFDTGADAPTLLDNLKTLGIDPSKIQSIALSHPHTDHTGGLSGLLQTGIRPTLYAPPSFPNSFKRSVQATTTLVEVTPGQSIAPGIFTTGEMSVTDFVEHALVIKTDAGLVVLTGCAHPGIVPIITRAKELFGEPVYLVMGGLHLSDKSAAEIRSILSDLRQLGVQRVAPSHCTGDQALAMFAAEYGDNFIRSGAGRIFTLTAVSTSHPFDAAWDDRAIFRQGLIASEQDVLNRLPGASVYRIDLQIPDDLSVVKGQMQVRYTNQETKPLAEIYFRLFANALGGKASVSAVKVDGQSVEPIYESQNTAVRVPLTTALPPGKSVVIQMDYQVRIPRELCGSYGLLSYSDDVLALDSVYPSIPVYDDKGWHIETPSPNADLTYADVSFYLVRVTAPAKLKVVASGVEVSRESQGDKQSVTFAAGPARDFYLAASEKYVLFSETIGETKVNSYAFAERAEHAKQALRTAIGALKVFGARWGAYPYTEFDVVSTPLLALGIEYPGMTGVTLRAYEPGKQLSGAPTQVMLEATVAHEVGHQWFYNAVGNDQTNEPWLDEAVTQYVTGLYYQDTYGAGAAQSYRSSWDGRWERVKRANIPIGLPAAGYAPNEYGAIVYGRGPLFVAAMAQKMGQDKFDKFLRDYYDTHKWGIGTGAAFKQLAERNCQCDLTPLFDEWVYKK